MMFDCLGYPPDHPNCVTARAAIASCSCSTASATYCQPCLSPVWDTALACHALMEVGDDALTPALRARARLARGKAGARRRRRLGGAAPGAAARRLGLPVREPALPRSRRHRRGRPCARPLRRRALSRGDRPRRRMGHRHAEPERRLGLLRRRQHALLPEPYPVRRSRRAARPADRGRQRRAASAFWRRSATGPIIRRSPRRSPICEREQEADGSWFGRWGTNYIYGTWSVLAALNAAGLDPDAPEMRRAVDWLLARQHEDGGWGEGGDSYWPDAAARRGAVQHRRRRPPGRCSALMAAGEVGHPAVARGIDYLDRQPATQTAAGTSPGTPRSASRACSTCAITAIAPISRYGRWPATAGLARCNCAARRLRNLTAAASRQSRHFVSGKICRFVRVGIARRGITSAPGRGAFGLYDPLHDRPRGWRPGSRAAPGLPTVVGVRRSPAHGRRRRGSGGPGRMPGQLWHRRRSGAASQARGRRPVDRGRRRRPALAQQRKPAAARPRADCANRRHRRRGAGGANRARHPSRKSRAWQETGALAVDLESVVVARAAAALGIPFLVLRADRRYGDPGTAAGGAGAAAAETASRCSARCWRRCCAGPSNCAACWGSRARRGRRWRR